MLTETIRGNRPLMSCTKKQPVPVDPSFTLHPSPRKLGNPSIHAVLKFLRFCHSR